VIRGDSKEYELLEKWAKTVPLTPGQKVVTVEIGVREGLGSKIIMDAIKVAAIQITDIWELILMVI
jgi:hypothetical protein